MHLVNIGNAPENLAFLEGHQASLGGCLICVGFICGVYNVLMDGHVNADKYSAKKSGLVR